jgi:hypothetical protein
MSDYNVCISARDARFVPDLEAVSRLVDFLDGNMYLDGPDRDDSKLVMLPSRDTQNWKNYLQDTLPDRSLPLLRKRYVHLLHSPTAVENYYKHYGELGNQVENIMPRDAAFVASLGRGTRRMMELSYCPNQPGEGRRWMQYVVLHVLRGYHALWDRVWDETSRHKVWELRSIKGFTLMISCKLNSRVEIPSLEKYLSDLQNKKDFNDFLERIGRVIGTCEFDLMGEHTA